jgi:putative methionine-R-sulfoxide reductase with GAF domain
MENPFLLMVLHFRFSVLHFENGRKFSFFENEGQACDLRRARAANRRARRRRNGSGGKSGEHYGGFARGVRVFWVGFYVKKENQLVLSAFQGTVACTRIDFESGVCGHCYTTREIVIVPNVDEFPGHIACSSASKSEIVLPVFDRDGTVAMVLDVDSDRLDDFTETDAVGLRKIVEIVEKLIREN